MEVSQYRQIRQETSNRTDRIDNALALIMALDRAIRNENQGNIYDEVRILMFSFNLSSGHSVIQSGFKTTPYTFMIE